MALLETILVLGFILICFSLLQYITTKKTWPYTVGLLVFGLVAKPIFDFLHLPTHLELSSEITYAVLLPILLFGSALHLNFHQFRLQFKTMSFLATFGLLVSIVVIGGLLALFLGWDLWTGLLFGALISATDPIAVLALFQNLGGPRRLALLADGESMLNDATAVVLFRILAALTVGGEVLSEHTLLHSIGEFSYVFIGSLIVGAVSGYAIAWVLTKVKQSIEVETTLTLGAALLVFTAAEHFFHLSGVIAAVIAGLFVGNLGRSSISPQVSHFVHSFWDYLGYLAVSFVFFFATYKLDLSFLLTEFPAWLWVVAAVLIARAVSVYLSIWLSNRLWIFADEPNVPTSWQHILNWGGLRGVIPLVLVFSLPETYPYKGIMFDFTFAALLFTLFINGSSMGWLLKRLRLHLPSEAENIQKLYHALFDLEAAIHKLSSGKLQGISAEKIANQLKSWTAEEKNLLAKISQADPEHYTTALTLQALAIDRSVYEKLLERAEISEAAFYELDAQLDLQADALEYPELFNRIVDKHGKIHTFKLFRQHVLELRSLAAQYPLLCSILRLNKEQLFMERYMVSRARLIGATRVLEYLTSLKIKKTLPALHRSIQNLTGQYTKYQTKATAELAELKQGTNLQEYEQSILNHALVHQHSPWGI